MEKIEELLDSFQNATVYAGLCLSESENIFTFDGERLANAYIEVEDIRQQILEEFKKLDEKYIRLLNFAPGDGKLFSGKK